MHRTILLLLSALAWPAATSAQVYRCQTGDDVSYADQPCGDNQQTITIHDNRIGGSFDDNLPPPPGVGANAGEGVGETASREPESTCRFINSTDLRTHLARNQVVKGMTREHVLKAFGRPPETYPVPQETWVYHTKYHGKFYELTYVYFRNGCVENVEYREP